MPQVAFDTLAFANTLKKAGLDPRIAEAHAELEATILNELTINKLATKEDLHDLKLATQKDFHDLKIDLEFKIGQLDSKVDNIKNELDTKIDSLDHKIDNIKNGLDIKIDSVEYRLNTKINSLENKLLIKLGSTMVGCTAILGTLYVVFPHVH